MILRRNKNKYSPYITPLIMSHVKEVSFIHGEVLVECNDGGKGGARGGGGWEGAKGPSD